MPRLWGWPRADATIADAQWNVVRARVRWLESLDAEALERLRALAARFIRDKNIVGAQGLEISPERRAVVAVLCCLPMLALGRKAWRGWRDVVLYPGTFRVRRHEHEHDDDHSVVTEWDDDLEGEAWSHGPIILSWAAIEDDLADPFAGCNVVAHEIAHKLDLLDGVLDGTPPLDGDALARWRGALQPAYDAMAAAVDRGDDTDIDPYAAESPDEFFAVVTEYYFSAPALLREHMPDVHAALREFYRIDVAEHAPP